MTELQQLQWEFMQAQARLALFVATIPGYAVTGGELWRHEIMVAHYVREGLGSASSVHPLRLAIDLNLFINGVYRTDTEAHRPLGNYWKAQHELARWGGDFESRPEGNHYSFEYKGHK